jgi:hypothetical protein
MDGLGQDVPATMKKRLLQTPAIHDLHIRVYSCSFAVKKIFKAHDKSVAPP